MQLATEWMQVPGGGDVLRAYRAAPGPAGEAVPALVLVHEIWGVDVHIRDLARRFAAAGYLAIAPDIYAQGGRRPPELEEDRIIAGKAFLDTISPALWWDEAARTAALDALPD